MRRALLLATVLLLAAGPAAAQRFGGGALLDPQKAFRVSARALDARSVEVRFSIAQGYYMYRDRFRFATEEGTPLQAVQIPRGETKDDPFFGRQEIFREWVAIRVPVSAADAARRRVALQVSSQGCADAGVCFLPQTQRVEVDLP